MLIVISPAKTLEFDSRPGTKSYSQPEFLDQSELLIDKLSTKSPADLVNLMHISQQLAELNVERFHNWSRPFKPSNAKQAVLAFKGDVYLGLEADKFTEKQLAYAQNHLRILSGLYGVLRPLDLMQAYRLEMGIKLKNPGGNTLYDFWNTKITESINKQLKAIDSNILLNLASVEYFKSIKAKSINAEVISPVFKDWTNGQYRVISYFAKKTRGSMARWVLKNKVKTHRRLTKFNLDGYQYNTEGSTPQKPLFLRRS